MAMASPCGEDLRLMKLPLEILRMILQEVVCDLVLHAKPHPSLKALAIAYPTCLMVSKEYHKTAKEIALRETTMVLHRDPDAWKITAITVPAALECVKYLNILGSWNASKIRILKKVFNAVPHLQKLTLGIPFSIELEYGRDWKLAGGSSLQQVKPLPVELLPGADGYISRNFRRQLNNCFYPWWKHNYECELSGALSLWLERRKELELCVEMEIRGATTSTDPDNEIRMQHFDLWVSTHLDQHVSQ
jgi:hypothetical protein